MKVFLLNLDRETKRLQVVDARLKQLGVEYERISGVYGAGLSESEKKRSVNRFRTLCWRGHAMRDGEIGCALSHQKAYKQIVGQNIDCACILEDDVVLDDRFPDVLRHVENWFVGKELDELVLLSNHSKPTGFGTHQSGYQMPNYNLEKFSVEQIKREMYAEGYVIGRTAAKRLLEKNYPLIAVADDFKRFVWIGAVKLFHAFPTVCWQNKDDFTSGTSEGAESSMRRSVLRMVAHKLLRAVGRSVDMFLIAVTRS